MAGRWSAATVCVLLVLGCSGSGADDDLPETFESPVYDYSLRHPAGWSTLPALQPLEPGAAPLLGPAGTDVIAGQAARTVRDMRLPAIVVGAQPVEPGTTLEDWTAEVEQIVNGFKGCAEPAAAERTEVGGEPAMLLSYPDCPEELNLDHLWAVLIHRGRGYQFVWFDESSDGAVEREQFEQILSTVSFPR